MQVIKKSVTSGLWEMTTSVIQQKGPPKDYPPYKEGIPLYHRSGEKTLDPTTLRYLVRVNKSGRVLEKKTLS